MSNNLVIVESPAKAKTIEKYLGKDFTVLSSIGHIRSIAKKVKGKKDAIDIANGFATTYEIDPEKKKVITELKKAVKTAKTVWLATDEDREGEAIAWHLCEVLGLDQKTTKRIIFHEITEDAIKEAIEHPRTVDMHLVAAQQARQILDRIVGFELSPVVWQKVPGGKSAGRVQSPAVRLLVEREREINKFESTSQFKITANISHVSDEFKAEHPKRFATEKDAHDFLERLLDTKLTVGSVSKTPAVRNPAAPFTTSTLQQEANSRLGFGSKATMASAQKLYQDGKITYMRTDSVSLSQQALAATASYVEKTYGEEFVSVRKFKTKSANAQEAHEAIRPTNISLERASSNEYDQKLYDLIRRRVLASQMAPAKLEKTQISIQGMDSAGKSEEILVASGEVVVFLGYLAAYGAPTNDTLLPSVKSGDKLDLISAEAKQLFARPPARYSEGSLVKKLEELSIGRPSTYATIINTVQTRGYVVKGDSEGEPREVIVLETRASETTKDNIKRSIITEKSGSNKGKLVPTPAGELIADFLSEHFETVVDYGFTASVEKHFDEIASNKLERNKMLAEFYRPFHSLIEKSAGIDRSSVGNSREVGKDPKSGKPIIARFGRFGPMLQLGETESDQKPEFAPMPVGSRIESITLEQALEAFKLPRIVGKTDDGIDIKANIGRFGPYIQIDKLFVGIKPLDPHTITLTEAKELYAAKLKAEAKKNIAQFDDGVKILNGRFGPYITDGKKNAKIPKDTDPKSLTHDQAKKLLDEASKKGKPRRFPSKKKK